MMKKLGSILLCVLLCAGMSVGAYASGESTGGGPDMMYSDTNEENSAIVIQSGVVEENEDAGSWELDDSGEISGDTVSGLYLTTADDQSNGLYLSEDDDAAEFTVGGEEDIYEVDGIGSFNTVIEAQAPMEDPSTECGYGVPISTAGGLLTVENCYLHTSGYRASTIYTLSGTTSETNLVVKDSVLQADGAPGGFIPDFKLLVGSARATLFLGEDIWLYNTAVLSRDWGALSHDTNTDGIELYAVNCYAETAQGGYCLYALDCTSNYMYGTKFVSPQYGIFIMGGGEAIFDSLDAADETALTYADGEDFSESVTDDGRSLLVGGINAVVFHLNGSVMDPGVLTISNTRVSTMPEDVVSDYGTEMAFDYDSYLLSPARCGESWFYLQNAYGTLITTRSHGGIISFEEGAELAPSNGVLVQTLVAYDDTAGNIFHDSTDDRELQDVTINIDEAVAGDILHQDYQRNMVVNVNDDYSGRVTTGSITAWNNLWTAENLQALLEQGGHSEDFDLTDEVVEEIRSYLVREEDTTAYTDVFGVTVNVSGEGCWTVDGESSVLSLNIEEGGTVEAAEIYVDCAFGEDGYLDPDTGTAVESLEAGSYENVVLIGGAEDELITVIEQDGNLYINLSELLDLLG